VRPAPPPRGPQLDPDTETLIILAVVGAGTLLYTTAAAATIIGAAATGGGWVEAGWLDHGRALVSLPWHPGDPAAGYPPAAAADLSGPVVWWSVAGVVLAVLVGVATWAVVRIRQQRRGGWARRRDLRALRSGSEGVLLGLHHGRPVAVEERHSTLVIGATQTHKTTGLAVPAILEADDLAVIALSVKDDIVSDTIGWRSTLPGHHWLFDPTDALSPRGGRDGARIDVDAARRLALRPRLIRSGWSPLAMTGTWQGALATAFDLARSGASADAGADGENKFFYDSAEAMLACYLYAAANQTGATMRTVVRWVAQHARDEVAAILIGLDSPEAIGHFQGIWSDDRKTLSNIFSTARLLVAAWLDPTVAASSERCDLDPVAFFNGDPNTLYLVAPPSNQDRLRVVFNMVVKQFVDHAYAQVLASGRPLDRRVLVIIDELANIAPIPNLGAIASTAASQGLQLVSIVQDLSQLRSRYGADDAGTIVNNHRALLLLSGVKDVATLELASRLLGTRERSHASTSRDGWGRRTRTESSRDVALAPIEDLRQQRRGTGTLIYGNLPGAELSLRPWFGHRRLRRRARFLPAGTGPLNPLPLDRAQGRAA
jgi:type IV secretion system protein VirD4